jgi:two-component system chemotaxis response regulator CheY
MAGAPKRRILLADDDPDVRRSLGDTLTAAGYEVMLAADGAQAISIWRERGGDLVILDLFMPEKDGLETIVELRHHSPDVLIIAISGGGKTGRVDVLEDAKLLGAVATLEKPFDRDVLLAAIATALESAA